MATVVNRPADLLGIGGRDSDQLLSLFHFKTGYAHLKVDRPDSVLHHCVIVSLSVQLLEMLH